MLVAFVFLNAEGFRQRTTSKKFYIYCLIIFLSNGIYCSLLSVHSNIYPNEHTELIAITYLDFRCLCRCLADIQKGRRFAREFEITRKSVIFLFLTCVVQRSVFNLFCVFFPFSAMRSHIPLRMLQYLLSALRFRLSFSRKN